MSSLNKVMLIGNVAKDIEVKYTQSGTAVASFSMATNEKWKNKQGEWEEKAEFHNITMWGKLAEISGNFLVKGKLCMIEGKLQTRKWQDKNGNDRYTTEIIADKMLMLGSKGEGKPANEREKELPPFDDSEVPF